METGMLHLEKKKKFFPIFLSQPLDPDITHILSVHPQTSENTFDVFFFKFYALSLKITFNTQVFRHNNLWVFVYTRALQND